MKKILQAFKRIFRRKEKEPVYYICDPKKNRKCCGPSIGSCWDMNHGPCKCTKQKKYAKTNRDGKPIVARPIDVWNDEYQEFRLIHPDYEYDE